MEIFIPDRSLIARTNEVDYSYWNYKFPIKYIQLYRFKKIIKLMGDNHFQKLLEIGTGSGIFLPELARHTEKLYALDKHPHTDKITYMLERYKINNFEISSQSVEKTNYPDNYFDAIVAVSVLEFVDDINKAVTEIKRILKKDGFFYTICPMNSKILDFVLSFYTDKSPEEEFRDSRKYVIRSLEKAFYVEKKGYLTPLIGQYFPIYTHFVLRK